jgi:hypothetical protein
MEPQLFFGSRLAIAQASVLLGIAEQELNLKPCLVIAQDVQRLTVSVGAEQQCRIDVAFFFPYDVDDAQHTVECGSIDDSGVNALSIDVPGQFKA